MKQEEDSPTMSSINNSGPAIPEPTQPIKSEHNLTEPSNPTTLQDALLVQVYLKRKRESRSRDGSPGEGTETERGSGMKRPRMTSTTPNLVPSSSATTMTRTSSYSITPIVDLNSEPKTQTTQANPNISFPNPSEGSGSPKNSRPSSRHPTPVPSSRNASRNHTPVLAPNSRPNSQPSSRIGSPTGWQPPKPKFSVSLPPSQPQSRSTSPRRRYPEPSSTGPGFAAMYPHPVNPPIQNTSIFTSPISVQPNWPPQPYTANGYEANWPPQQRFESVRMEQRPHLQPERVAYHNPHPPAFQDMAPHLPHYRNFAPRAGASVPFVQGPAPGPVVGPPHPDTVEPRHDFNGRHSVHALDLVQHQMVPQQTRNVALSQLPPYQFRARHDDPPVKGGQPLPIQAPKPSRRGDYSMTIERHADVLMDFLNTMVKAGIKNRLLEQAPGILLTSLEGPVDGGEGSTKRRCDKSVGTDDDQAVKTDTEELFGSGVEEKPGAMHRTFATQEEAWAEERRLLIQRQEELEEEKRVSEERRAADAEQMSKERIERTSKMEYLASKVKELQQKVARIIREQEKATGKNIGDDEFGGEKG